MARNGLGGSVSKALEMVSEALKLPKIVWEAFIRSLEARNNLGVLSREILVGKLEQEASKRPARGQQEASKKPARSQQEASKRPARGQQEASKRPGRGQQ